jgi:hypothetical protein
MAIKLSKQFFDYEVDESDMDEIKNIPEAMPPAQQPEKKSFNPLGFLEKK